MLSPIQYWLVCILAVVGIVLVAANGGLYFMNRSQQGQFAARAQYIQQSQSIGSIYREMVKELASLAVERHDEEIKALLAQEGLTINVAPADAAAPNPRSKP